LIQDQIASEVVGVIRPGSPTGEKAKKANAIHRFSEDLCGETKDADLIVLATNVHTIIGHIKKINKSIGNKTIVIDVGSVKEPIVTAAKEHFEEGVFVGCHPLAGKERAGIEQSESNLFEGSVCLLMDDTTNANERAKEASKQVTEMWQRLGAHVVSIGSKNHDKYVAFVSHLPHAIAYSMFNRKWADISDLLQSQSFKHLNPSLLKLAGLAKSDNKVWTDIFVYNKKNVTEEIMQFIKNLEDLLRAIEASDVEKSDDLNKQLKKAFENAGYIRA